MLFQRKVPLYTPISVGFLCRGPQQVPPYGNGYSAMLEPTCEYHLVMKMQQPMARWHHNLTAARGRPLFTDADLRRRAPRGIAITVLLVRPGHKPFRTCQAWWMDDFCNDALSASKCKISLGEVQEMTPGSVSASSDCFCCLSGGFFCSGRGTGVAPELQGDRATA